MSCSESFCNERNELSIWLAFVLVVFWSPWYVIEHRDEDDPFCKILWCFTLNLNSNSWIFVAELQSGESWEDIPLEFNWLTINSVQSSVLWWTFEPRQSCLPMSYMIEGSRSIFPRCNTESEYEDFSALRTDDMLITEDKCFHEEFSQLIVFTP